MDRSVEAKQVKVEVMEIETNTTPDSERKTPRRRFVQSTLFSHISRENGQINNNCEHKQGGEEEDGGDDDDEEYGSQSDSKRKRKGKATPKPKPKPKSKRTPSAKTPIHSQEGLSERIETKDSLHSSGLQIDLTNGSAKADELAVVNGNSPDSEKKTPRKRFTQSTLFPLRSQENGEGHTTCKDEDGEDDVYCGSQSNAKRKRKGKGKPKCTPPEKAPTNSQEALCGSPESKNDKKLQQNQRMDKKGADSPGGNNTPCIDLESGPCKRSSRRLKRGQSASPLKDPTPGKLKTTPSKLKRTPSKLKGSHCKRLMSEFKSKDVDPQSEHATEPVFDLRLEAKIAAEENARLFAGRQTHPFFSLWKMGKKTQGTSEATELENKGFPMLHKGQSTKCCPIHVFEMLQEDPVPLDWSNWTFNDESSLDSSCKKELNLSSSFNGSAKPLKVDEFLTTSDPVGTSILHTSANSKSTTVNLADERVILHQREHFQTVHESYSVSSLDVELEDRSVSERKTLCYRDCSPQNSLWTNKYQPKKASEVCGNGESVRCLNEWLASWREKYSHNRKNSTRDIICVIEDSDYSSEESDSDAESIEERADLKNVLVVNGPVGSGKSAAIYACAREQGFQVIEVSASDWRNGVHMKQKFGAAMDSLGLNKWSLEDPLDLRIKHNLELPSTQTSKSSVQELGDEVVEVFPVTCREESDNFKAEPGKVVDKDNLTADCRGADKTLILFEDVDTIFDEDRGLITSIQQIAETSKRPIILTSNIKDPVLPDQLDRLEVCFTIPSPEELLCHVNMVCAAEQADIHPHLLQRLIKSCQGDIRKTIMLLQFWCQSKINKKDSKLQSTYGPHCFDLDAGHQILPKVLPWEFPCQLSKLVEKEITNSLVMVKKTASLVDIEEDERSSKEMEDVWQIEAKKESMLRRNHFVDDGNEIPVLFDNLDDFSNSSGSPVACTRRTSRRRLRTVLSSHSEDEFCTDKNSIDLNILPVGHCSEDEFYSDKYSKDSDILHVDRCNGMFPDVSHGSVAYRDLSPGQLNHPEKEIPKENPFDCFPAETDQHPCETYKSVDVSCVPESSFVAETEINDGVQLLSDTVSCGCDAVPLEPLSLSNAKSTFSLSVIEACSIQKAVHKLDNNSEAILGNTCEVHAVSVHRDEEVGDSQHEHAESVTRRFQVMDECSRAGLSTSSISWESRRCMGQVSTVPETWRRLSCCRADLSSYVTSEQRNALQIVKLASGLTDLISAADLMFGPCQPLFRVNS
ncbi:hypothetical protein AQUCO_01400197v1 [Aquilegia coerulea]|uniref:AAA+ ATPase domain-containing protein n=1 Tax=Aquilegia coerulea TaxID=218851 RepID=A0A2G5DV91_AQUCA|nr:hypothetical protein AQUCO_01400197v1 [Aquilegia coerulea]